MTGLVASDAVGTAMDDAGSLRWVSCAGPRAQWDWSDALEGGVVVPQTAAVVQQAMWAWELVAKLGQERSVIVV